MLRHPERRIPPVPKLPSHPSSARHVSPSKKSRFYNSNLMV
jgi:hypothetical protein